MHDFLYALWIKRSEAQFSEIPNRKILKSKKSVNIIRGLSTTQKSKTFTKRLHNLHHTFKVSFHGNFCHAVFWTICNLDNNEDIHLGHSMPTWPMFLWAPSQNLMKFSPFICIIEKRKSWKFQLFWPKEFWDIVFRNFDLFWLRGDFSVSGHF